MVNLLLTAVFGIVMIAAAVIAVALFWEWFYAERTSEDEIIYVRTQDGRRLALHRYRASGAPRGLPVILCHGLSANRFVFELRGAPSLARYLSRRGMEVWVPELRGSGMSDGPGLGISDAPYGWDFEDHLFRDVPAVLSGVLEHSGAPAVHWVGHSMGGLLILAHLAHQPDAAVASAVAVGSPAEFAHARTQPIKALLKARRLLQYTSVSPLSFIARFFLPLAGAKSPFIRRFFYAPNIDPAVMRKMVVLCMELVTSSRLWLNFGDFLERGIFGPAGGSPYLEKLSEARTPILFLAGSMDRLAPPDSVMPASASEGHAGPRELKVLGTGTGCGHDYGHVDLLLGRHADAEVFPFIAAWMETHDPHSGLNRTEPTSAEKST